MEGEEHVGLNSSYKSIPGKIGHKDSINIPRDITQLANKLDKEWLSAEALGGHATGASSSGNEQNKQEQDRDQIKGDTFVDCNDKVEDLISDEEEKGEAKVLPSTCRS